jgi:hypothetical protein
LVCKGKEVGENKEKETQKSGDQKSDDHFSIFIIIRIEIQTTIKRLLSMKEKEKSRSRVGQSFEARAGDTSSDDPRTSPEDQVPGTQILMKGEKFKVATEGKSRISFWD